MLDSLPLPDHVRRHLKRYLAECEKAAFQKGKDAAQLDLLPVLHKLAVHQPAPLPNLTALHGTTDAQSLHLLSHDVPAPKADALTEDDAHDLLKLAMVAVAEAAQAKEEDATPTLKKMAALAHDPQAILALLNAENLGWDIPLVDFLGWQEGLTKKGTIKAVGVDEHAGKTLYGEPAKRALAAHAAGSVEKSDTAIKAVRSILDQGGKLDAAHFDTLASHLPNLSGAELKTVRKQLVEGMARRGRGTVQNRAQFIENIKGHVQKLIQKVMEEPAPEQLQGGKADGKVDAGFPPAQLQEGAKVEQEHTAEPAQAKEIAKDHLVEDPKAYTPAAEETKGDVPAPPEVSQKPVFSGAGKPAETGKQPTPVVPPKGPVVAKPTPDTVKPNSGSKAVPIGTPPKPAVATKPLVPQKPKASAPREKTEAELEREQRAAIDAQQATEKQAKKAEKVAERAGVDGPDEFAPAPEVGDKQTLKTLTGPNLAGANPYQDDPVGGSLAENFSGDTPAERVANAMKAPERARKRAAEDAGMSLEEFDKEVKRLAAGGKPQQSKPVAPAKPGKPEQTAEQKAAMEALLKDDPDSKPKKGKVKGAAKKSNKAGTGESLQAVVRSYGGIDANDSEFKRFFANPKEAMEYGISMGVFKKGGNSLDQMAKSLKAAGHIVPGEGEDEVQHLVDQMTKKAASAVHDATADHDKNLEEYYKSLQEDADLKGLKYEYDPDATLADLEGFAHDDPEVEKAVRTAAAAVQGEKETGTGEEGGAGVPAQKGGDSFDFGLNAKPKKTLKPHEVRTVSDTPVHEVNDPEGGVSARVFELNNGDFRVVLRDDESGQSVGNKSYGSREQAVAEADKMVKLPPVKPLPEGVPQNPATHAPKIAAIPKGGKEFVGGYQVTHNSDGTFAVQNRKKSFHSGTAEDIARRISEGWNAQKWQQKSVDAALQRAESHPESSPFDPATKARYEAESAKAAKIPDGVSAVSTGGATKGRVGEVRTGSDGVKRLHFDDSPDEFATEAFEPLDEKHSYRTEVLDKPKAAAGKQRSLMDAATESDSQPASAPATPKPEPKPDTAISRRRAISQYTADGEYRELNKRLRNGEPLNQKQTQIAEALRAEIGKEPELAEPKTVYRHLNKMKPAEAEAFVSKMAASKGGGPVSLGGFLSTSTDRDYADRQGGSVQLQISASKGIDLSGESRQGAEKEFLLPDDAKFEVVGVEKRSLPGAGRDISVVKLRQVPAGQKVSPSVQGSSPVSPKSASPPVADPPQQQAKVSPAGRKASEHIAKMAQYGAGVPEAHRQYIQKGVGRVVGNMPSKAHDQLVKNLKGFHYSATPEEFASSQRAILDSPEMDKVLDSIIDRKGELKGAFAKMEAGGLFSRLTAKALKGASKNIARRSLKRLIEKAAAEGAGSHIEGTNRVFINHASLEKMAADAGESVDAVRDHVIAHELSHNLDVNRSLSGTPEWEAVQSAEIARPGHPLSAYASSHPTEGFAEFAAALYTSDAADRRTLASKFPKATAFFKQHGLWPEG